MRKSVASYRSRKTAIRQSDTQGRGLFAQEPIAKGETVSVRNGHIVRRDIEPEITKPDSYWGYPISDEFVLAPLNAEEVEDIMMFLNHSCAPNIGILGQILFVAMRDIEPDEELTIDYAMFGADSVPMQCACRSVDCRGQITSTDWTDVSLQERYKGYFSSFMQRKIDEGNTSEGGT